MKGKLKTSIAAEIKLGEYLRKQKENEGLNRGQLLRGTQMEPRENIPTLAEVGIGE